MVRNPLLALGVAAAVSVIAARSLHPPVLPTFESHFARIPCTVLGDIAAENATTSYSCVSDTGATLTVSAHGSPPAVGSRLLLRGRLEPFDAPRNPGEPDERLLQRERGVSARLSGARTIRILPRAQITLKTALAFTRAWALAQFHAYLPEPQATILAGELWGERAALPPELRAEFQETGTVHILVTAGLHLGVVAAIVLFFLRMWTLPRGLTSAIAILAIWIYALFSGLHLPSMRAAIMIAAALCAYGVGRAAASWNIFGAAILCIALFDPQAVGSASFALSFSCVGAILLCARPINDALGAIGGLPDVLREALALSLATQIGT
ncbi:MAG TPA: ComEC/Rec2 family competence protein, partial [Candidatus Rubrimentiphilum sp.]|nr:ComEC/Rec2 family competence protein [Candidatus Rubrimentiphilum sp.]